MTSKVATNHEKAQHSLCAEPGRCRVYNIVISSDNTVSIIEDMIPEGKYLRSVVLAVYSQRKGEIR